MSGFKYQNHYRMKKAREERIKIAKGVCEICRRKDGQEIHHLDGTTYNHDLNNLLFVCKNCQRQIHLLMRGKTIKIPKYRYSKTVRRFSYRKVYGMSYIELLKIAKEEYGLPQWKAVKLLKNHQEPFKKYLIQKGVIEDED